MSIVAARLQPSFQCGDASIEHGRELHRSADLPAEAPQSRRRPDRLDVTESTEQDQRLVALVDAGEELLKGADPIGWASIPVKPRCGKGTTSAVP